MLNDIIATLLTVGGVGFVNFMVTEQLGTVNLYKDSNQARLGYSLIWSIVDFSIYLLAKNLLSSFLQGDMLLIAVMLITLVGAWLITYLLAWPLHDLLFTLYSKKAAQHKNKDFLIDNQSVLESALGIEDKKLRFMFMILNIIHRGTVFSLSTALMRITVVSVLIFLEIQMGELICKILMMI